MDNKQEFSTHLQTSFKDYFSMTGKTPLEKVQAKSYINGLMAAGRIFGISFEELQDILTQEQSRHTAELDLNIPSFIRNMKKSK